MSEHYPLKEMLLARYSELHDHLMLTGVLSRDTPAFPALSPAQAEKFSLYLGLLERWSKRIDLVAEASTGELIERHFVDSWAAWLITVQELRLREDCALLDVGSGAGLPGIVVALLEPQRRVYLCEPREKRAIFLKEVRRELDATNCLIVQNRMERISEDEVPDVGLVIERALGEQNLFLTEAKRLTKCNGYAVQMLGPHWEKPVHSVETGLYGSIELIKTISYALGADGPGRILSFWRCFT